jgi:hypothetical protein
MFKLIVGGNGTVTLKQKDEVPEIAPLDETPTPNNPEAN